MKAGGPKRDSLDHLQYGVHYGIVCQNKDPENLDRIKVRLPWLDQGDVDQTHWAQLVTPMEGKKFGWYTLPDVDDVVVVMFIGGDTSQPIVLGGIWSKPDFSPEPNSDGKNIIVRTLSEECGLPSPDRRVLRTRAGRANATPRAPLPVCAPRAAGAS